MKRVISVAAAVCAIAVPIAGQQPTFSLRRESVRVDVLVTDRGQPVRGLTARDFDILDSGVPQTIDLVSFEQVPLTIALVLDGSPSISAERLANLRDAGAAVLEGLDRDDQVALLTFTDAVTLRERLTGDTARIRLALDRMSASNRPFGGTALIDACYTALAMLDADGGRNLLIAFTDGLDTSSWLPSDRVLESARRSNIVSYAVSTAPLSRGTFLRDFTDATGGDAIEIGSTDQLRDLRTDSGRVPPAVPGELFTSERACRGLASGPSA